MYAWKYVIFLCVTLIVAIFDSQINSFVSYSSITIDMTHNTNGPVFQERPYRRDLTWRQLPGMLVPLLAIDADGDTVTYYFDSNNDPEIDRYFRIDKSTGEIYLVRTLPPKQTGFVINVVARDNRDPEQTDRTQVIFTVEIDEFVPDYGITPDPNYGLPLYRVSIPETEGVNTCFYRVEAQDLDLRGMIMYMVNGNFPADDFFRINETTGQICVLKDLKLDTRAREQYELHVLAYDSDVPETKSEAVVLITVIRNPDAPFVDRLTYNIELDEFYNVRFAVLDLNATDPNGDSVYYTMITDTADQLAEQYFWVFRPTGHIFLRQPLTDSPADFFRFYVDVTDNGNPPRTTRVTVNVNIRRIGLPKFNPPFQTIIRENINLDVEVINVLADHPIPQLQDNLVFELIGTPPAPYFFRINYDDGDISVQRSIKQDRNMQYRLTVKTYDPATPSRFALQEYIITVLRNENGPSFNIQDPYVVEIPDDSQYGRVVIQLNATDADDDFLTYTLTGDAECLNNFFVIPALDGTNGVELRVQGDLTTTVGNVQCDLEVTDNGYPQAQTSSQRVIVNIRRGEMPSWFPDRRYSATLNENDPNGTFVVNVEARKANPLGMIMYEVIGDPPAQYYFNVDPTSGLITTSRRLLPTILVGSNYLLKVVAYDSGRPNLRTTATITITVNRNLRGPKVNPPSDVIDVIENENPIKWFHPVNVTDPDSKRWTCSIIANAKAQEFFKIDPDTCLITLKKSLENDTETEYPITVQVIDDGDPAQTGTGVVIVRVARDIFPPTINLPATRTIEEDVDITSFVFEVNLDDLDKKGNFKYDMIGVGSGTYFFKIDPDTGRITVRVRPKEDSLQLDRYTIRVEGYDSAWPTNRVTGELTILVNRNPSGPQFIQRSYTRRIRSDFDVGGVVIQLNASDSDGDQLMFESLATPDQQRIFQLNNYQQIILGRDMRYLQSQTDYSFQVRVYDNRVTNRKSDVATVTITVIPLLGPPKFVSEEYSVTIPIITPIGSGIFNQIFANDEDLQGDLRYKLEGFKPGTDLFDIDPVTAEVSTKASLNNDERSYLLYISAYDTDAESEKGYATLRIFITRNLQPPVFVPSGQLNFVEFIIDHQPMGTVVINMTATDADMTEPENLLSYSLFDNGNRRWFQIDAGSGVISLKQRVSQDNNKPVSYELLVIATDRSSDRPLSSTATVVVNVERNVPPQILNKNSYIKTISEGQAVSEVIDTIESTDANPSTDLNGMLEYFIVDNPQGAQASQYFRINASTGAIRPRISLKDISITDWTFTVGVTDKGIPPLSDSTSVTINIQRLGGPSFTPREYKLVRLESLPVETEIITVLANDPTPDGPLRYTIVGLGLAKEFFRLGGQNNRTLVLNKSFADDNYKTEEYEVVIRAERVNDPDRYAEVRVYVRVTRNPSRPTFSHGDLVFNISETIQLASVFGKVNASDPDTGSNGEIQYSIIKDDSTPDYVKDYFFININNGELSVIKNLRSDKDMYVYELQVMAKDKGTPSAKSSLIKVTVYVTRNPSCPKFTQTPITATIDETVEENTRVVDIEATDQDGDPVEYSIITKQGVTLYFKIDSTQGIIRTNAALYTDQSRKYEFVVTAYDLNPAACTASVSVTVTVNRNPTAPYFSENIYRVRISEYKEVRSRLEPMRNGINTPIYAEDDDPVNSPGGKIFYRFDENFQNEDLLSYFTISKTTGVIFIAKPLTTRENLPDQFNLTVIAYDESNNPKQTSVPVEVTIVRNQFRPEFSHPDFVTVSVNEYSPIRSTIYDVNATDADFDVPESRNTPNAQVAFKLIDDGDYSRFFSIDSNGVVMTTQQLVVPRRDFNITVQAEDLGWEKKTNLIYINIKVIERNISEAVLGFIQPTWWIEVKENHPKYSVQEIPKALVYLDVANQGENFVDCEILSGNQQGNLGPTFTIRRDRNALNCELLLSNELDYEKQTYYKLDVNVRQQRVKRQVAGGQSRYQYRTWPDAVVHVYIKDVNDNSPQWVIPKYPRQADITKDKYFKAIDINTKPGREILTIFANDSDSGKLGLVTYNRGSSDRDFPAEPPFQLDEITGAIITTLEFGKNVDDPVLGTTEDPRTFRFPVQAHDQMTADSLTLNRIDAEVIVHLVEPKHRFVLEVKNRVPEDMIGHLEKIRLGIQEATGFIALIEEVVYRRYKRGADTLVDDKGTDIIFVLAKVQSPNFPLLTRDDSSVSMFLADGTPILDMVQQKTEVVGIDIHEPYEDSELKVTILTKSYIWWTDDPWAALVALAGISILLCIVGIIVLVFTHSRYLKYVNNYRIYQQSYEQPEFIEPPSFLREYETQSLQMQIPPDEPAAHTAEITGTFSEERISSMEITGGAAINPVYDTTLDDQQVITTMSYSRDTRDTIPL